MAEIAEIPLTQLRVGESAKVTRFSGAGGNFIEWMQGVGVYPGATVTRILPRPIATFPRGLSRRQAGRNRGKIQGQGLGLYQISLEVKGQIIRIGIARARRIFVKRVKEEKRR